MYLGSLNSIRAVLFDFGGVMAEEGFRDGMAAIASAHALDHAAFFDSAVEIIYSTGFIVGSSDEHTYWTALRKAWGIHMTDTQLKAEILSRFLLRPWAFALVKALRRRGLRVCLLSDQTNWLDELNTRDPFFHEFDAVFNSYHIGYTKRDPSTFTQITDHIGTAAVDTLFIDDSPEHVERARARGLNALVCTDEATLKSDLVKFGLP